MPLISKVEIENFRCFEKLTVSGLTRVNLIVGGNNSGKTALLEAIAWAADEGNARTIYAQLERREENISLEGHGSGGVDLCALFHGTPDRLTEASRFSTTLHYASQKNVGRAEAVFAPGNSHQFLRFSFTKGHGETARPEKQKQEVQKQVADTSMGPQNPSVPDPPRRDEGSRISEIEVKGNRQGASFSGSIDGKRVPFVSSNVSNTNDLKTVYARVGASRSITRAEEAMRHLDPRIQRFGFVPNLSGGKDKFEILLKGEENGHPIGRFGEGFRRAVRLAFALGEAQGSVLLIDELENGIHYSAMQKILTFLIKTARDLDVQVFVATHSKDVLEAIAALHLKDPDLIADLSIHRLEAGRPSSVYLSPESVLGAIESEQEVR